MEDLTQTHKHISLWSIYCTKRRASCLSLELWLVRLTILLVPEIIALFIIENRRTDWHALGMNQLIKNHGLIG